jgi:hypothetical protein
LAPRLNQCQSAIYANGRGHACTWKKLALGQKPTSRSVITNAPFARADEFIRHALRATKRAEGRVAMLLPTHFDTAQSRRTLFAECRMFAKKWILTRRIRWSNLPQKKNIPSTNHAWFVWDWKYEGPPVLGYLPLPDHSPPKVLNSTGRPSASAA